MSVSDIVGDARDIVDGFDLADYDEEYECYQVLVEDEHFGAVCHAFKGVALYADSGPHPTEAEREAKKALKRAIREHAQRVRLEARDR